MQSKKISGKKVANSPLCPYCFPPFYRACPAWHELVAGTINNRMCANLGMLEGNFGTFQLLLVAIKGVSEHLSLSRKFIISLCNTIRFFYTEAFCSLFQIFSLIFQLYIKLGLKIVQYLFCVVNKLLLSHIKRLALFKHSN